MKAAVLLTVGFFAAATHAVAADFSRVDLRPYLLISYHLVISDIFEPTELTSQEQQLFVSHGGAAFSSRVIQVEQETPSTDVYRGIATPAQLRALRDELNSAKIRAQRSCESDTLGAQSGSIDFIWHSVPGRRNTFRVVFASRGESGLPPCRQALSRILSALQDFEEEILLNPDTEILLSAP